ncbi:MAG: N-acetyltransferase family protein [Chitinophagaceae bacterium]|nr:MAG: N-acetyltransferase family protein [Chitinophagaceae bacterium]
MEMIRLATQEDLQQITAIYNQAVLAKFETADTDPVSVESRENWLAVHPADQYPVIVYEYAGIVRGWCSISPYRRGRGALRFTAEISYYVDRDMRGRGIGGRLLESAIALAASLGFRNLFAIVLDRNHPSIRLLEKSGFRKWGEMPGVADFDGDECGHLYYGKRIAHSASL